MLSSGSNMSFASANQGKTDESCNDESWDTWVMIII
jgi:hypothetical protein